MDIQTLFNTTIPARMAKEPGAWAKYDKTYEVIVTGTGGGSWNIKMTKAVTSCTSGSAEADTTINLSADDFALLYSSPFKNGRALFILRRMTVTGSPRNLSFLYRLLRRSQSRA